MRSAVPTGPDRRPLPGRHHHVDQSRPASIDHDSPAEAVSDAHHLNAKPRLKRVYVSRTAEPVVDGAYPFFAVRSAHSSAWNSHGACGSTSPVSSGVFKLASTDGQPSPIARNSCMRCSCVWGHGEFDNVVVGFDVVVGFEFDGDLDWFESGVVCCGSGAAGSRSGPAPPARDQPRGI